MEALSYVCQNDIENVMEDSITTLCLLDSIIPRQKLKWFVHVRDA
jgi:hypothetical protein